MSAQQLPQQVPVRLLIADTSENIAHELDSMLRDAGIPTRPNVVGDLEVAAQVLADGEADMVLCNGSELDLTQIVAHVRLHSPTLPVILLTDPANPVATDAALELGATDVVPNDEPRQLMMVVRRELKNVGQRVHYREMRRALQEAERRCRLLLQSSKAAIAYVHEGMHIYANEAYFKMFGFSESDDLLGLPLIDLATPDSATKLKEAIKSFRGDAEEECIPFAGQSTDDKAVNGTITLAPAQYEGEACLQVTIRRQEIPVVTQIVPDNSKRPPKTDSPEPATPSNGSRLDLPAFLKRVDENADSPHLFVAVVDGYEKLQMFHGFRGVMEITEAIEQLLQKSVDDAPFVRLDTRHFAFAIPAKTTDEATELADTLRKSVEELLLEIDEKTVRPTVSVIGQTLHADSDANATLNNAFHKLAEMDDDCNKVIVVNDEPDAEASDEAAELNQLINDAIDNKKFTLLFQPIISLRGDSDEHYEVFLRMLDSKDEQMRPAEFLQTAIDNNIAYKIDRWVILQSIRILSAHRAKGHSTRLTINVTCNSVADPEFIHWLGVAIKAARLPSDAVIFQVTEADAAMYVRQTREFVEALKGMHVRASLSRFGSSEESFETLKHVPVEFVKLDGTNIEELKDDAQVRESVSDMIRQLQSSGKLTIVPMVESAHVLSALWQAGANYIQGHYLQEPSEEMDYDFTIEDG